MRKSTYGILLLLATAIPAYAGGQVYYDDLNANYQRQRATIQNSHGGQQDYEGARQDYERQRQTRYDLSNNPALNR